MRASTPPVRPSTRIAGGGRRCRSSWVAAASVRKLKKAPLSTVSGTAVPLMPTVATARDPTIFTGNSSSSTWQAAPAVSGSARRTDSAADARPRAHASFAMACSLRW